MRQAMHAKKQRRASLKALRDLWPCLGGSRPRHKQRCRSALQLHAVWHSWQAGTWRCKRENLGIRSMVRFPYKQPVGARSPAILAAGREASCS